MNNAVIISGKIVAEPSYSHSVNDEHFNKLYVSVERESGISDTIPIILPVRSIEQTLLQIGIFIQATGQYRAHTSSDGHKCVFVLARAIALIDEECYANVVSLVGVICKEPCYRALSTGKEITGLILANNQKHNKSYYLPVVVWDRLAKETSLYCVGDMIECKGRIQSRTYYKNDHVFCVYEMSVQSICKIKSNK